MTKPPPSLNAEWQKYTGKACGDGAERRPKDSLCKKLQRLYGFLTGKFPNVENSVGLRLSVFLCELTSLTAAFTLSENTEDLFLYALLICLGSLFAYFSRRANSCLVKLCITAGMLWVLKQFIGNLVASPYDTRDSAALLLSGLLVCHSFDTPRRRDLDYSLTVSLLLISYSAVMSASFSFIFILLIYLCCLLSALCFRSLSLARENAVPLSVPSEEQGSQSAKRSSVKSALVRFCAYFLLTFIIVNLTYAFMPRFGNLSFFKLQHRFNFNLGKEKQEDLGSGGGSKKEAKRRASQILDSGLRGFADEDDLSETAPPNSDRLIMKVKTNQQTYYRGLAFSKYDGKKWSLGNNDLTEWLSGQPMQVITGPDNPYCIKPLVQIFYIETDMPNLIFAAFQPYSTAFPYGSFYIDKDCVMRSPQIIEAGSVYTVYSIPPYVEPYVRYSQSTPYVNASPLPEEREALRCLQQLSPDQEVESSFLGCSPDSCFFDYGEDDLTSSENPSEARNRGREPDRPAPAFDPGADPAEALPGENEMLRHLQREHFRSSYRKNRERQKEQRRLYTEKLIKDSKGAYFFRRDKHPAHMRKRLEEYRQLPPQISPRLKALAHYLTHRQPSDYMKALAISHYLRANYVYQNPPPPCPEDREPIDYFLFTSQRGNCRQFAGAMALLCRAAHLPARYINGYAPGAYNPFTMTYEVRENDAHAWTEVMIPMLGWVSYDATSPHAAENGSGIASEQPVMFFYRQNNNAGEAIRKYLSQLISDDLKAAAVRGLYSVIDVLTFLLPAAAGAAVLYVLFLSCGWLKRRGGALLESLAAARSLKGGLRDKIGAFVIGMSLSKEAEDPEGKGAIARYRAMLARLKLLKIDKRPSQTPREFADSIKAEALKSPVRGLTDLYERAYYGASPLAEDPRLRAALDEKAERLWQELKEDSPADKAFNFAAQASPSQAAREQRRDT